jgi:hypothetical protein
MKNILFKKLKFPENPWPYFLTFLGVNLFLSYSEASFEIKLWVGFMLVILPLGLIFSNLKPIPAAEPLFREQTPLFPSRWVWVILILLFISLRFYHWSQIPSWPTRDEVTNGFLAMQLDQKWRSNLFFSYQNLPPFYFWLLSFFFKFVPPSLTSLWLLPSLISILIPFVGYWTCRMFFSRSLSFLWFLVCALSFWPLFFAKLSMPPVLIPLFELSALGLLGLFRKNRLRPNAGIWAALFGLMLGLGFYTFFNWLWISAALGAAFLFSLRAVPARSRKYLFAWAFLPAFAAVFPLLWVYFHLPKNSYFQDISIFAVLKGSPFDPAQYLVTCLSHVTALFWGTYGDINYFGYRPYWGGFLNPLLGSLFFTGLIQIVKRRSHPLIQWILASSVFFFIPAFLSLASVEGFRVISLLPVLFLGTALGFESILKTLRKPLLQILFLVLIWILSIGLDLHHLSRVYSYFWSSQIDLDQYADQQETFRAHQILDAVQQKLGPGFILTEFDCRLGEQPVLQSLALTGFPYDAGRNSRIDPAAARWAALPAESRDFFYLKKEFPNNVSFSLGESPYRSKWHHPFYLVLIPLTAQNQARLIRWWKADQLMEGLLYESVNEFSRQSSFSIQKELLENKAVFSGDSFLELHRWNWLATEFEREYQYSNAAQARQMAILEGSGLPLGDLYFRWGLDLDLAGNHKKALQAILMGSRFNPSHELPKNFLEDLKRRARLEK